MPLYEEENAKEEDGTWPGVMVVIKRPGATSPGAHEEGRPFQRRLQSTGALGAGHLALF